MSRAAFSIILLGAVISAAQAKTVTVLMRGDRQSVDLAVGDKLRVVLGAQSGTGYRWVLRNSGGDAINFDRSDVAPVSNGDMPGSRASQSFWFRATDTGRDEVSFALMPPGKGRPERLAVLSIKVKGGDRPKPDNDEPTYDDNDNGTKIRLRPGDTFVVRLKANKTTGYSWHLMDSTPDGLDLVNGPRYVVNRGNNPLQPGLGQMVGVGGYTWYRFRAKRSGWGNNRNTLALRYSRGNSNDGSKRWVIYYTIER